MIISVILCQPAMAAARARHRAKGPSRAEAQIPRAEMSLAAATEKVFQFAACGSDAAAPIKLAQIT